MVAFPNFWEITTALVNNMAESTAAGTVGVSLIFIYLAWIVGMALFRIYEGAKEEAHH